MNNVKLIKTNQSGAVTWPCPPSDKRKIRNKKVKRQFVSLFLYVRKRFLNEKCREKKKIKVKRKNFHLICFTWGKRSAHLAPTLTCCVSSTCQNNEKFSSASSLSLKKMAASWFVCLEPRILGCRRPPPEAIAPLPNLINLNPIPPV
jgi:hypothetical protein